MSSIADLKKTPHTCPEQLSTQPLTPPETPLSHTCNSDQLRQGVPGLPEAEKEKSTRPRWCHTSLSEILCWPAGPHLQDHQSLELCEVPSCFSMLHHHLHPKETQNYRTKWLQAYGSNVRGHKVIWKKWCWPTWRTSLDPRWNLFGLPTEQTGLWTMQSTWDCIMFCNI